MRGLEDGGGEGKRQGFTRVAPILAPLKGSRLIRTPTELRPVSLDSSLTPPDDLNRRDNLLLTR